MLSDAFLVTPTQKKEEKLKILKRKFMIDGFAEAKTNFVKYCLFVM